MQPWQIAFRRGFAPQLPTAGLVALARALERDDPAVIQDATIKPPPLECLKASAPAGACPVAFCGWKGLGLSTVAEVDEFFARVCIEAAFALGDPAAPRYLLNHWDDTCRERARLDLLDEVRLELDRRRVGQGAGSAA